MSKPTCRKSIFSHRSRLLSKSSLTLLVVAVSLLLNSSSSLVIEDILFGLRGFQPIRSLQQRVDGLDPEDYIDEAGELDIMKNQQQIPTADLMTAAGYIVPENFFVPGTSIPAMYPHVQNRIISSYQVQHNNYNNNQQFAQQNFQAQQDLRQQDGRTNKKEMMTQASEISLSQLSSNRPTLGPAYSLDAINSIPQGQTMRIKGLYGFPTKTSSKKPSDMLDPLGSPKMISSPVIDLLVEHVPKNNHLDLSNQVLNLPNVAPIASFSSNKDVSGVTKAMLKTKRTVMMQAENLAKNMVKSINNKFGTNLGEQSDIPFLLSSIGPLGKLHHILSDPTLFVTLLNSAERTLMSDVLPGPAKMAVRPILNIFRMPNKRQDESLGNNIEIR